MSSDFGWIAHCTRCDTVSVHARVSVGVPDAEEEALGFTLADAVGDAIVTALRAGRFRVTRGECWVCLTNTVDASAVGLDGDSSDSGDGGGLGVRRP